MWIRQAPSEPGMYVLWPASSPKIRPSIWTVPEPVEGITFPLPSFITSLWWSHDGLTPTRIEEPEVSA